MVNLNKNITITLLCLCSFQVLGAVDVDNMLNNLLRLIDPLNDLVLIVSYISGVFFILKSLLMLKIFGQQQTQTSRPGEIAGPLVYLFTGTALLYLPTTINISSNTLMSGGSGVFDDAGVLNFAMLGKGSEFLTWADISGISKWDKLMNTLVVYVQFIGLIAFVRGWFLIAHSGQPGVQPGSISKGIVHVIGGIISINFVPFVKAIHTTITSSS